MSTIRADSVSPAAGGTSRNLPRGVAAAWFNLNGTGTIAGRDSVNISSYTDNGTGDYTGTVTSAFSTRNYASASDVGNSGGGVAGLTINVPSAVPTTTAIRQIAINTGGSALDVSEVHDALFGSLA